MKILNKVLCLTAFFAIGSVSAKPMGAARPAATAPGRPAVTTPGKPATSPVQQPVAQKQTYKQIHDEILKMKSGVLTGNMLDEVFISKIAHQSSAAGLEDVGFRALLQTARDKFAPFTGDNDKDLAMLKLINAQIDDSVGAF